MALHDTARTSESGIEDVYATGSVGDHLPKFRVPRHESSAREVYSLVHDELMLDGNARQNLATFCTTWSEPDGN